MRTGDNRGRAFSKSDASLNPLVVGAARLPNAGRPQPNFRALTMFESLPPGHVTFWVRDNTCAPHLRENEYAVVDTTDREPVHGELFIVQWQSGERRRAIVQARAGRERIAANAEPESIWWLGQGLVPPLNTEQIDAAVNAAAKRGTIACIGGRSDGLYLAADLRQKLIGRVVGVALTQLDEELAQAAGWENEDFHNDQFDPAEYLDVVIATGHKPMVALDEVGQPHGYCEYMPRRPLSDAEDAALLEVRWKYVRASTALRRVSEECVRRGLVRPVEPPARRRA
jgi:hypothetical protein